MNKTKELKNASFYERLKPPTCQSKYKVCTSRGRLNMDHYEPVEINGVKKVKTNSQRGIGTIGVRKFTYKGSLN